MKLRTVFFSLILLFSSTGLLGQTNLQKEEKFKQTSALVAKAFCERKFKLVNKHLDSKGIYVLVRPGAIDRAELHEKLDSSVMYLDSRDFGKWKTQALQYGKMPSYDCDKMKWSRKGFFADTVKKYHPVSNILKFENQYEEQGHSQKKMNGIKAIENTCRKIILSNNGDGLILYLRWNGSRWVIYILDMVETDCSA